MACETNKTEIRKITKFPQKISLDSKGILSKEFHSVKNIIGISDSILIVSNYKENYNFYLINKNNFKLITKAIKRGRGPREVPWNNGSFLDHKKNKLYIPAIGKSAILSFPIKSLLQEKISLPEKSMILPSQYSSFDQMQIIEDSLICFSGYNNYSLFLIDKKGEEAKKIGELPTKPEGIKEVHYTNMHTRFFTYNPYKKKFAVAFKNKDVLSCYNSQGKKIFEIIGPDEIKPDYNRLYKASEKMAYFSIKSDKKLIYGLYSGRNNYERLSKATTLNKNIKVLYPKTIHVFDWQGNPKLEIKLDKSINDFVIDKETNRLIGISSDDQSFVVYDFSKIRKALEHL